MDSTAYNLSEYEIARNPAHPGCCLPTLRKRYRDILDVGCGAGQTLAALELRPGVRAFGVDPDARAVAMGQQLWPALDLRIGRGEALPFAAASFDLVFSRVALPYMDVPRALAEMSRVLRPGGDLWLVVHGWSMWRRRLHAAWRRLDAADLLYQGYVAGNSLCLAVAGRNIPAPLKGGYESVQTVSGMRRLLAHWDEVQIRRGRHFVVCARKAGALHVAA